MPDRTAGDARRRAKETWQDRYSTGKPCKYGHVAERYTRTGICVECSKMHNNNHRPEVLERRRAKQAEYRRKYAEQRDVENNRLWQRRWKQLHPLKARENRETTANHARSIMRNAVRALPDKRAAPAWVDCAKIQKFYELSTRLTAQTGVKHEVDHIIPIKNDLVCGLHVQTNLRVVTMRENRLKRNHFDEWVIDSLPPVTDEPVAPPQRAPRAATTAPFDFAMRRRSIGSCA